MILLEKIILLRDVNLFKSISDELLAEIAFNAAEVHIHKNQYIIRKGHIDMDLYIIVEGHVAVKDEERKLAELGKGEIFGELAVLSPEQRTASVVAIDDCVLLKLARHHLIDNIAVDINLAMGIIEALCSRIRAMSKQIQV